MIKLVRVVLTLVVLMLIVLMLVGLSYHRPRYHIFFNTLALNTSVNGKRHQPDDKVYAQNRRTRIIVHVVF